MLAAPRHHIHDLEQEHREDARRCELKCLNELEQRRRALADEYSRLCQRVRRAAGA